jgi:flagella basal body P-ring formation protein FlgA
MTDGIRCLIVGLTIAASAVPGHQAEGAQRRAGRPAPAMAQEAASFTQTITGEQLRAELERLLKLQFGDTATDVKVRLLDDPDPVTLPDGHPSFTVSGSADDLLGRRLFPMTVSVNERPWRTVTLKAEIIAYADVVAAQRYVRPDEVLQAEDVTLINVPMTPGRLAYARSLDDVVGKRVKTGIQPKKPILHSVLANPYTVRKGDRVTIEAQRGGLLIQTAGVSKAAAQSGDSITVLNVDSGKEIRAHVVAPGVVRVGF